MLTTYLTALQRLIQAPTSPTSLVPTATATSYINTARNQLAADAECMRNQGTLLLAANTRSYLFSAIAVNGIAGYRTVIAVRSGLLGAQNLEVRSWEWYQAYNLGNTATGTPTLVAQQGQGVSGTLFFSPLPNAVVPVTLDCVCLPIDLVDDATVEAIPDLWRDAVPFYAAWLAMQSLQRQTDAEGMLQRYMLLARRGRQFATPSELPENMPGGAGTQMAAAHSILGQPPAAAGGR